VCQSAAAAADNDDTSVWSAVSDDDRRRRSADVDLLLGGGGGSSGRDGGGGDERCRSPADVDLLGGGGSSGSGGLELSRISDDEDDGRRVPREQASSGELTGAWHSTFSYPLHSTLLLVPPAADDDGDDDDDLSLATEPTAAAAEPDDSFQSDDARRRRHRRCREGLQSAGRANCSSGRSDTAPLGDETSSVPETAVAEADPDEQSDGAPPIGSSSASDAARRDVEVLAERRRVAQHDVAVWRPAVANSELDRASSAPKSAARDFSIVERRQRCPREDAAAATAAGRTARRTASVRNQTSVISSLPCYVEAGRRRDGELGRRTTSYFPPLSSSVDASTLAAAAGVDAALDQRATDGASSSWPGCGWDDSRARGDDVSLEAVRGSPCADDPASTAVRPSPVLLDVGFGRHRRDVADARGGPSPGRPCRSASQSGGGGGPRRRGMARETGRCDLRHTFDATRQVGHESPSVRELFRVRRSRHRGPPADCRSTGGVDHHGGRRQRRPRCRCCADQLRTLKSLAPPGESNNINSGVKRCAYLDPVRKRTLVNRLKQFSGCFCDTGCGRRMRTLANV